MNHGELVELCVAVFDTQRESFLSPEDHLKDFLDTNVRISIVGKFLLSSELCNQP